MDSLGIAAFIAFWAFWFLLAYGYAVGELTPSQIVVFLLLWIAGRVGLVYLPWAPAAALFFPYLAVLDIALVFTVFEGDVRLS